MMRIHRRTNRWAARMLAVLGGIAMIAATSQAAHAGLITKTENFDSAASAAANGWTEVGSRANAQNYGFSNTTNAGGSSGEAGGTIFRREVRSAYADVFGSYFTLDNSFTATGSITSRGGTGSAGVFIGWFDSERLDTSGMGNAIGLLLTRHNEVIGGNPVGPRADIRFEFGDNTGVETGGSFGALAIDQTRFFEIGWNPTGGTEGFGQFTVSISDSNGVLSTLSRDMTEAQRLIAGTQFNAFGMFNRSMSNGSATGELYIDNLTYSAVPEPSSLALLGLCLGGLALKRKRRRNAGI